MIDYSLMCQDGIDEVLNRDQRFADYIYDVPQFLDIVFDNTIKVLEAILAFDGRKSPSRQLFYDDNLVWGLVIEIIQAITYTELEKERLVGRFGISQWVNVRARIKELLEESRGRPAAPQRTTKYRQSHGSYRAPDAGTLDIYQQSYNEDQMDINRHSNELPTNDFNGDLPPQRRYQQPQPSKQAEVKPTTRVNTQVWDDTFAKVNIINHSDTTLMYQAEEGVSNTIPFAIISLLDILSYGREAQSLVSEHARANAVVVTNAKPDAFIITTRLTVEEQEDLRVRLQSVAKYRFLSIIDEVKKIDQQYFSEGGTPLLPQLAKKVNAYVSMLLEYRYALEFSGNLDYVRKFTEVNQQLFGMAVNTNDLEGVVSAYITRLFYNIRFYENSSTPGELTLMSLTNFTPLIILSFTATYFRQQKMLRVGNRSDGVKDESVINLLDTVFGDEVAGKLIQTVDLALPNGDMFTVYKKGVGSSKQHGNYVMFPKS